MSESMIQMQRKLADVTAKLEQIISNYRTLEIELDAHRRVHNETLVKLEKAEADAGRYRWLRNKVKKAPANMDGPAHPQLFFEWDFWNKNPETHNADGLDAAIDAVRGDSSQAQNGGGV